MTEQEFLIKSRELMKIVRKSLQLCDNIQKELNEDYENKLISYEEWKKKTEENREKIDFFIGQFNLFSERLERVKKY